MLFDEIRWFLFITIPLCFNCMHIDDTFPRNLQKYEAEIDQLPKDVDTLILHMQQTFNPESSSSFIQPLRLCANSSEQYLEYWSIVNNFNEDIDNPSVDIVQSTKCFESDDLDVLKLLILQIKNDFFEVLKFPAWSNSYIDVKISYEHELMKYPKYIDEIAKKIQSENGKKVIAMLKIEYKTLDTKIRAFFNRIQSDKRLENDKLADQCATEIIENRIDSAIKIFNEIAEERIARQIIVKANQNENNFQRVFEFVELLGYSAATQYAYQGLIMSMASKNRWYPLNSLVFLSGVEKRAGSEYATIKNTLQIKLKPFIQSGDYSEFYSAVNSRISGTSDFGINVIPTFSRLIYNSDVSNVIKILDMQSKFDHTRHKLRLIDSLITEMKIQQHTNKPEFLMVLSDLLDLKVLASKVSNDKQIYDRIIIENVPFNLVALMYSNFCIRNSETEEYMHANDEKNDDGQRQIFTSNELDETYSFEAEFLDRGRSLVLKNVHFNEYLRVVDGELPRKLMLGDSKNDKRAHFVIEAVDSINVRIKNVQFMEFLYTSNQEIEEINRMVQTESQASENSLWKLRSCSNGK